MTGLYYSSKVAPVFLLDEVQQAPIQVQTSLLASAALDYLEFTCCLEDGPVKSVCRSIAGGELPVEVSAALREEAGAVLTEEIDHHASYLRMLRAVEAETGLTSRSIRPAFLDRLELIIHENEPEHAPWIRLFFVIVSETLITRQLTELASDLEIMPELRRLVVDHARDEARHHKYFRTLFQQIWPKMQPELRISIGRVLPQIIRAYLESDPGSIERALGRFPDRFPAPRAAAQQVAARQSARGDLASAARATLQMFWSAGVFDDPLARFRIHEHGLAEEVAEPDERAAAIPSVVDCLLHAAVERAEHPAVVFVRAERERGRLTYGALDRRARAVAVRLQREGLTGQRVLIPLDTGLEFAAAFCGVLYAGATPVPAQLPVSYRNSERLMKIATDCDATAALTTREALGSAQTFFDRDGLNRLKWICIDEVSDDEAEGWVRPPWELDAPACLQYTSGTTGAAKGVVVTHRNLFANASDGIRAMGMRPTSTIVSWLPLFHDMGLVGNLVNGLVSGATIVLMPGFDFVGRPIRWLRAISQYRADISGGPDFAYAHCVSRIKEEQIEGLDLSSWRLAFNGSEQVRASTLRAFRDRFGRVGFRAEAFFPCYGLAESTVFVTGTQRSSGWREAELDAGALDRRRSWVSCGSWGPSVELKIVDPQVRREVRDGAAGEVWIRSKSVANGYWNKPAETRATFGGSLAGAGEGERPFLRTGDLGFVLDHELFICGRIKDVIIVRGRNYVPEDFEQAANAADPMLAGELNAAFSVDTDRGENVVLVCEVKKDFRTENSQSLSDAVRGLINEKTEVDPHDIVFVRRGLIPRSSSGKVQRSVCRELYLEQRLFATPVAAELD